MDKQYSDFRIDDLMANLGVGQKNAISRANLAKRMDMPDRTVRSLIEKARCEGCLILNAQDGKGYYLASGTDDILRQYRQDTNRALSILKRRKHMRKLLKEAGVEV
jgi:biotin operon repressor